MIASLPMYDRPETAAANDRFWALIRAGLAQRGIEAPAQLCRGDDLWGAWQDPALVLSQTCGLPFRARLHGRVTLVATPDYGVEGCAPGYYRSVLVARADDPRGGLAEFDGADLAYNDPLSQSGWAAPWAAAQAAGIRLRPVGASGAHRASARAVVDRRADLAAIDAVTWRMIARWDGWAAGLRVIGMTCPTPGLPLIAVRGADVVSLRGAIETALDRLDPADKATLGILTILQIPSTDYLSLPIPPAPGPVAS